jgi:hydrogenase maturation protease
MNEKRAQILIVGYGNPLRGDDGVGWHIACYLAGWDTPGIERAARGEKRSHPLSRPDFSPQVAIVPCHQLMPELADMVSQSRLVIFIDACQGTPAGAVSCKRVAAAEHQVKEVGIFSHHFTPALLLTWTEQLYGSYPEGMVISVNGESFEYSEHVSLAVLEAVPVVLECVDKLVGGKTDLDGA